MRADKTGRIVWHDLFTGDRQRSMSFYQRVAGWDYRTEHATDFAWGGGEKDFVLALLGGEAGAGFAETPPHLTSGWIAYVEVEDVDATADHAETLGGTIVRQPFEVPGVGRNALLGDPLGALIGISVSRHDFPAPRRQFGVEVYVSNAPTFPEDFYTELFDWTIRPHPAGDRIGNLITGPSGDTVAMHLSGLPTNAQAIWMPSLRVADPEIALRDAEALGGEDVSPLIATPAQGHGRFLRAPDGALSRLVGDPA